MNSHLRSRPAARRAAVAVLGVVLAGLSAALWWRWRPSVLERVETRAVPVPVEERYSVLLARGWQVVVIPGRPGETLAFVRIETRGGREGARRDIEVRLVREPLTEVRILGTGEDNAISAPKLTRAVRVHEVLSTAYDPGPVDNSFEFAGTTKLGWRTRRGIVAVDPRVIPLRSLLYVAGYGLAWAGDVGGAIKGDRVDLCFNRTEDAVAWGRRWVRVYVLEGVRASE
jgi:3D (Asp-Asp-Asp) domain-containing protein